MKIEFKNITISHKIQRLLLMNKYRKDNEYFMGIIANNYEINNACV